MLISAIDKEYTKEEATSANAYVAVDSETLGTGKLAVSALGGGGSSDGAEDEMIVTFIESTPNSYPADITRSVDKTFAEIKAAYDSGIRVYATAKITYSAGTENETTQKNNTKIPLVSADDSMIVFEHTTAYSYLSSSERNYSVQFVQYKLLSNNTWTSTFEGKNFTDEVLILKFDSDKNIGKTLNDNATKPLKILRLNTNDEGSHFMDLNLIDSSSNLFGGVGLVEGVLSYVQVDVNYNPIEGSSTTKTITPLSSYGSDWFIVNFSYDANTNTYTADKTFNEISQWYAANGESSYQRIKGIMNGMLLHAPTSADHQTPWIFEGSKISDLNGTRIPPVIIYAKVTISDLDEVSFNTQLFNLATTQGE